MAVLDSLRFIHESSIRHQHSKCSIFKSGVGRGKEHSHSLKFPLCSFSSRQDAWSVDVSNRIWCPINSVTYRSKVFLCRSFWGPNSTSNFPNLKEVAVTLARSYNALHATPLGFQLVPAVGVIAFAMWGLGPLIRYSQKLLLNQAESNWKKAGNYHILTSYLQPLLLWTGAILVCRALDPVTLPSEASQIVKQRLLNFVKSLSTVLAFAYCLSSLIQQMRKFFVDGNDANDTRNMSFQFASKAVYTAVWIAALSLFMELLGFSTQKWLTAGGLGTVLLTLAGREIFTNFLSSVMLHATRPFVLNEWIQTKIEGYEVSGTVEHVGWWSPTVIRGENREAIHIPNHKFTVTVVRNLSQKTHWRIKTHLAISHLDVNKINNIVADMRKVLAKNPQVEQQRLHRRVFLDNIDPENQALLIMISCFVKTSHFEEYLCVKEAILLDLLRVIRHHRARLATPIRTMQKIHPDPDLEHNPFTDFSRSRPANNRPYLLIEPPYKIHGNDKVKTTSAQMSDIQDIKTSEVSESKTSSSEEPLLDRSDKRTEKDHPILGRSDKRSKKEDSSDAASNTESAVTAMRVATSTLLKPHKGKESQEIELEGELDKGPIPSEKIGGPLTSSQKKNGNDRSSNVSSQPTRPCLEDNIVLGVALDGSKRTLPIEETISPPTHLDGKELAACRNGNNPSTSTREKKQENQISTASGATVTDARDQER